MEGNDIGRQFTRENAAEMGRRGGKASGNKRKFAKTFKEAALASLKKVAETKNGDLKNAREAIADALIREAIKGNTRAAELLMSIVGESPTKKMEITGKDGRDLMPAKTLTKEEAKELFDKLNENY